ncbi:MAG: DNA mismatch repair endonuclease MutL [Bacteroidales bacterium]|jgi:DNA mismatch repair protein MutL|nr:DNA mismatch repair endonuclease MutL [Bacteroidales bacterium]
MADIIKLLPDSVANQIAAGEVIQRPASIVKELVENSVDAGSSDITVIIKDSGKTLVQVVDNGAGMSETDARLAFERHATSKIISVHDLNAIRTNGFRGEALASIAAVAMVELKTRRSGEEAGTIIRISGSKVETQEPCSCREGSSFAVKNLFFNIPARRKFLKSDNTEMRHIVGEFQKIALARPEIRFHLHHNNSEIYNLPAGNLRQRITGVFGRQINTELIPLETETTLVSIRGFVCKPESARKTFGEQFFYVNNRFMKHPYFHRAVNEAYQRMLPPDAIPSYFICMETDPASIDVNVHPSKTEIKFENERQIWQILVASVREALGKFNIVPSIDFGSEALFDIPVRSASSHIPNVPPIRINPAFNPFDSQQQAGNRQLTDCRFEHEDVRGWEKLFTPAEKDAEREPAAYAGTERKMFQVKGRYIACPVMSGIMLIDQKRAHERVLYEKYMNSSDRGQFVSQTEMFPVTVEMNPSELMVVKEIEPELSVLGFRMEYAENSTVVLTGRPADEITDPAEVLKRLAEEYKSSGADAVCNTQERIAATMASVSAIQYGKSRSQQEMENLFDALFTCREPNYSAKGKPVITIMKIEEIDSRF